MRVLKCINAQWWNGLWRKGKGEEKGEKVQNWRGKKQEKFRRQSRRETSFRAQGDPESHLNLTRATINGKLRRQAE